MPPRSWTSCARRPAGSSAHAVLADSLRDATREAEIAAALDGDRTAIDAVLGSWPEHKHGWLSRILGDSEAITEEVTDLLTAWLPLYQEIEPRVKTIIERDVALRAGDRSKLGPAELQKQQPASLMIEDPVRSGQSVVFMEGDVTILGSVGSGAEIVAGG